MAKEYIERANAAEYFEKSEQMMWHKDDVAAAISQPKNIPVADVHPREQIAQEIFNDLLKEMMFRRESIGDFYEIPSISLEEIARKYIKKEGTEK